MLIRALKGIQLTVAIATTLALGAGLLWPGVMGLILLPFGLVYVFWTVRAALDQRLSIWLSFASTLAVAVFLGAFALSTAAFIFRTGDTTYRVVPLVPIDPAGNVVEPPPETLPRFQQAQARIDRRDKVHAALLILIASGAWLVIVLYAFAWRWAVHGEMLRSVVPYAARRSAGGGRPR